jgi:hypothetical protein
MSPFFFDITIYKGNTRAAPWHSKNKHWATTLDCSGSTTALLLTHFTDEHTHKIWKKVITEESKLKEQLQLLTVQTNQVTDMFFIAAKFATLPKKNHTRNLRLYLVCFQVF